MVTPTLAHTFCNVSMAKSKYLNRNRIPRLATRPTPTTTFLRLELSLHLYNNRLAKYVTAVENNISNAYLAFQPM